MALYEEYVKTGNWLFRWRSYLPIIMFVFIFAALGEFRYFNQSHTLHLFWSVFCLFVSFIGMVIRAITIGCTPKNTSGRNVHRQIADVLNTSGIYSTVRHPLYLGNFFMGLGIALLTHNAWIILIYILLFWVYYERIMFAEEAFLLSKFGHHYQEWSSHTPAFIPRLSNWKKSQLNFSFKNILRREYAGLFGTVAAFALLETIIDWYVQGHFTIDLLWGILFAANLVIYVVLRTLRHKSSILRVEGR